MARNGSCSASSLSTRAWSSRDTTYGVLLGVADALGERERGGRQEEGAEAEEGPDPRVHGQVEDREDHGQQGDAEGDAGLQVEGAGVLGLVRSAHGRTASSRAAARRIRAATRPGRAPLGTQYPASTGEVPADVRMAAMKLYADHSARFAGQVLADILFVCWLVAWVWIGHVVHDATLDLAGPGRADGGVGVEPGRLADRRRRQPRRRTGGRGQRGHPVRPGGRRLRAAGRRRPRGGPRPSSGSPVWLGLSIALIPILVVSVFYLPRRLRFVREATAGTAVHRRAGRPRPVRAARDDPPADARAGPGRPTIPWARCATATGP